MSLYGYARSRPSIGLLIQCAALGTAAAGVIRAEQASATRRGGRTELQLSLKDLHAIVHELKAKKRLNATEQSVDTGITPGKSLLDMLGVSAEFETDLRREHQLEGISAAKARGVYKGGEPSVDAAEIIQLPKGEARSGDNRAPARH